MFARSVRAAAVLVGAVLFSTSLMASPASAVVLFPTLAVPTTANTTFNTAVDIDTPTITANGATNVSISISTTNGTLTMTTLTGLTFVTGDGTTDASMQFNGSAANMQNALNSLRFTPTASYVGTATITYNTTSGDGLFYPGNGHFYEFVSSAGIDWDVAKDAAEARTLNGLSGYLVTLTNANEQAFVQSKLSGQGWMGASDANSESVWEWATGPEAGQVFWRGTYTGASCTTPPCAAESSRYNNWSTNEPNDASGEDYAHFLVNGTWNDYNIGNNSVVGYVTEYGGGMSDPDPVDVDTTTVTVAAVAPGTPTSLVLTPSDSQVAVTWTAPSANGAAIDSYDIDYRANSTGAWTTVTSATNSKTLTGLLNGTSYEVRVRAHNSIGFGPYVTSSTATPTSVPDAPADLALTPSDTSVHVTWNPPVDNGGDPITSYVLEYRAGNAGGWTAVGGTIASPVTIDGLTRSTGYQVRIKAINSTGSSAFTVGSATTLSERPRPGTSVAIGTEDGEPTSAPVDEAWKPIAISIASTPDGGGTWAAAADGGVFTSGDAPFYGSMGGTTLNEPVVGITRTTTGGGYYLLGSDGGVFTFGDAEFHGSTGALQLNQPVKALVPTCTGEGYYLVAEDGGVFSFGDALFHGSMGGQALNKGVIGIVPTCDNGGYWLYAKDGGVFTFGTAHFYGSLAVGPIPDELAALIPTSDDSGYWLIDLKGRESFFGTP